jgi:hypothetical protein
MTLASSLKPLARSIRGIPGALGVRPHRVFLVTESWSGLRVGEGVPSRDETEIVEGGSHPPKVSQLNDERLALAGLPQGSIEIGPVTSDGLSVTAEQLRGAEMDSGRLRKLRISGPLGDAWYSVSGIRLDRAIHWMITAQPLSSLSSEPENP